MNTKNNPITISLTIHPERDKELFDKYNDIKNTLYPYITSHSGIFRQMILDMHQNVDPLYYKMSDALYSQLKEMLLTPFAKESGWYSLDSLIMSIFEEKLSSINSMSITQEAVISTFSEDGIEKVLARRIKKDIIINYPLQTLQNGEREYSMNQLLSMMKWDLDKLNTMNQILDNWVKRKYILKITRNDEEIFVIKV